MTTQRDWLAKNHEALVNQATQTNNYLTAPENKTRMGFGDGALQETWRTTEYVPKFNAFSIAVDAWKDTGERTSNKSEHLQVSQKAFVEVYRHLYTAFLKNSPFVTDEDLHAMGLPTRTSGSHPSPVPTSIPKSDTDTHMPRRITINFYEGEAPHKKANPPGVHGAEIVWQVFDAPQTVMLSQLTHSSFDTHTPLTLEFTDEQRGHILYFALRWENTRSEKGPFGEIQMAVIP
jgi:hypothetical protein